MATGNQANNAYATWRQFSAQPKVSTGNGAAGTYQAQAQRAPTDMGTTTAEALAGFARAAGAAFQEIPQALSANADRKVQDWMKGLTIQEYREKMRTGDVPFQDDPMAMSVLHNKAAYHSSLQVEEDVQNKITSGAFQTPEEMDKYRIDALGKARGEFALTYGISPDDKAFVAGFDRDQERRRELALRLQSDVTNKRLQTQAKIVSKSEMVAPLPDVINTMGPEKGADYIIKTAQNNDMLGQTRSEADQLELITHAMDSLTETKGGPDVLRALGNKTVSFGGKQVTLRDAFGGGKFDLMVNKAEVAQQSRDANLFNANMAKINQLVTSMDDVGLVRMANEQAALDNGIKTPMLEHINSALTHVRAKQTAQAAQAQAQYATALEQQARINKATMTLSGLVSGQLDAAGVSTNFKDLGLADREERSEAEQGLIQFAQEGPQRDATILKLAATIPDGFAHNALKTVLNRAEADWGVVQGQIATGKQDVQLPDSVKRVMALSQVDEASLLTVDKKPSFLTAIQTGQRLGMDPIAVAQAQAAWKAVPEKQRQDVEKKRDAAILNMDLPLTQDIQGQMQTLSGHYLSLGVGPEEATKRATQDFKDQNVQYGKSMVPKQFLKFSNDPASWEGGKTVFEDLAGKAKTDLGIKDDNMLFYSFVPTSNSVFVRNLQTGDSRRITQDDLREGYKALYEKAQAVKAKKTQDVLDSHNDRVKRRNAPTPDELNLTD